MSTNIKLKRSAVQGKIPTTSSLELGELAINTYDGKLFLKKDNGTEAIVDVTFEKTDQQILNQIKNVDGSGSGLDADLLDGLNSTQFLRSNTDDTMTGSLTVTDDLTINTNTFYVDSSNKRVGIGTDNPNTELEVSGASGPRITLTDENSSGTAQLRSFNNNFFLLSDQDTAFFTSGSEKMRITSSGGVGIGSISPNAKLDVDGDIQVNSLFNINAETGSTSSTTQTIIASFDTVTYSSAKFLIQAKDFATDEVHLTEILVIHDGTTANATEYGTIHTGVAPLATYDVDISSGSVRLLATAVSSNNTTYKVVENLITV